MTRYEGIPWCNRHNRPIDYDLKHSGLLCIEPTTNPYLGPRLKCGSCAEQGYKVLVNGEENPFNNYTDVLELAMKEFTDIATKEAPL